MTGSLVNAIHPSYVAATVIFVVGHVLGTTLLGLVWLRGRVLPVAVAWMLLVSQPLHLLTTAVLGLPWLDLVAWAMTAFAMGCLAADRSSPDGTRSSNRPHSRSPHAPRDPELPVAT